MNRWRSRLAELEGAAVGSATVQNVQNVQSMPVGRAFEPFEHSERRPCTEAEPGLEKPCAARRGRVQWLGKALLHFCVECGAFGAFGYGVRLGTDQLGRWYCAAHRPGAMGGAPESNARPS